MDGSHQILDFGIPADDFPLGKRLVIRDSVAYFESQTATSDSVIDSDFLKQSPAIAVCVLSVRLPALRIHLQS
jgi:hypothetical protein